MNLAEYDQFSQGEAATVGFLRQVRAPSYKLFRGRDR